MVNSALSSKVYGSTSVYNNFPITLKAVFPRILLINKVLKFVNSFGCVCGIYVALLNYPKTLPSFRNDNFGNNNYYCSLVEQ